MTDDDRPKVTPLDSVEAAHAMSGVAAMCWAFYASLKDEGFDSIEALRLTVTYIHGMAGGKIA